MLRSIQCALALLLLAPTLCGQSRHLTAGERRASTVFEAAAKNPLLLRAFLESMPKGGDLHMHLSGSVYAERFIADAREDLLCIDPPNRQFVTNIGTTRSLPPQPVCGEGKVRASMAFDSEPLYNALIDSFSMRSFVPSSGFSGHDQFFATFDRFDPTHTAAERHGGVWLDEIATRAATQQEQYLEIMHTPDFGRTVVLAKLISWPESPATMAEYRQITTGTSDAELAEQQRIVAFSPLFAQTVNADRAEFAKIAKDRKVAEHCGTPDALPGCAVDVRFLFQVLRATPPSLAFVQTMLAFVVAQQEMNKNGVALVVGLNFVQPEDHRVAMAEYTRQMRMIQYFHTIYPKVHISLHAGELSEGLVPPDGLRFHIRQAMDIGNAERIGHGVDVMREEQPELLLAAMAHRHIMVEINLTSNDEILGIRREQHPFRIYRSAHVPIALSSDDEGVSRIDLTHEYVRAATEFNLGYIDFKQMARASLEHSFLPGRSLWNAPDDYSHPDGACSQWLRSEKNAACELFLRNNPRAAAEAQLELRLNSFEGATLSHLP